MTKNPQKFLYPVNCVELPPAESESAWLGKCVETFKTAVRGYKGGSYE